MKHSTSHFQVTGKKKYVEFSDCHEPAAHLLHVRMQDVCGLVLVVQDGPEGEDGGQVLPLVPDHKAVGDVVLEHLLDGVLDGDGGDVLPARRHDDLLLSPRHEQEPVLNKGLDNL